MKTFFYMKPNPENQSGVSYKIWMIERKGRIVTTSWAPAECFGRRLYPAHDPQSHAVRFRTEREAIDDEQRRVRSKLAKGYDRKPRRRLR